ncbi:hypothetical protein NZA98_12530, partial [Escherichia coli]|nr:hypothetical protein [Escherichia coli]
LQRAVSFVTNFHSQNGMIRSLAFCPFLTFTSHENICRTECWGGFDKRYGVEWYCGEHKTEGSKGTIAPVEPVKFKLLQLIVSTYFL